MAASLLTPQTLTLGNVPHLADIATMAHLLQQHGVDVSMDGGNGTPEGRTIHLNAGTITSTVAPYDLVRKMRASVLVLGPLLARFGEAEVSLPGDRKSAVQGKRVAVRVDLGGRRILK